MTLHASNVEEVAPARARRRLTAFGIDVLIFAALFYITSLAIVLICELISGWDRVGDRAQTAAVALAVAVPLAFSAVQEIGSRSSGKRLMKLSIAMANGTAPTRRARLVRWTIKFLPGIVLMLLLLIMMIVFARSPNASVASRTERWLLQGTAILLGLTAIVAFASFSVLLVTRGRSVHDFIAGTCVFEPAAHKPRGFEVLPTSKSHGSGPGSVASGRSMSVE